MVLSGADLTGRAVRASGDGDVEGTDGASAWISTGSSVRATTTSAPRRARDADECAERSGIGGIEVEDAGASPSPAPKITGTDMETKDLMSDVASLKAFAEAITVESTAVAAAAVESAVAAAAATMMGMVGGGDDSGKPRAKNHTLVPPWTLWRRVVHLWIATSLGLMLR